MYAQHFYAVDDISAATQYGFRKVRELQAVLEEERPWACGRPEDSDEIGAPVRIYLCVRRRGHEGPCSRFEEPIAATLDLPHGEPGYCDCDTCNT